MQLVTTLVQLVTTLVHGADGLLSTGFASLEPLYISDQADLDSFAYSLTNKAGCTQLPMASYNLARVAEVCGISELARSLETKACPPAYNNTAYELSPLDMNEKQAAAESTPVSHLRRTRESYSYEMAAAVNRKHSLENTLKNDIELHHKPESIRMMVEGIRDNIVNGLADVERQIAYDTMCLFQGTSPATAMLWESCPGTATS